MDENRLLGSDAMNLDRLERLVRRDRNHPSVVVWSIANEEGVQTTPTGGRVAQTMQNLIHRLDPTREATMAANTGNDFGGLNRIIDVRGWNYHIGRDMDDYHAEHPLQPNVGTEQASTVCTRGIYANDRERGYVSAYDENAPPWAHTTETWWKFFAARHWLSGGFAWTGFDYRGEPTPYGWPCINSHFGIVDTCGFPKDNFYYYQAWWGDKPMAHLLPHWTWPGREGQEIDVRCFSNGDEAELFLNNTSLGKQSIATNSHARWKVKYSPGVLAVKAYKVGKLMAEDRVETAGAPAALQLTPDRSAIAADSQDAGIITVAVTDAKGHIVPTANNLVKFELSGPARIRGVGNGDPSCHEPDTYLDQVGVRTLPIGDWHMKDVPNARDRSEVADQFNETDWREVDVRRETGPLRPNASAVFRAHFSLTGADAAAADLAVNFGMIDDDGWVYVNGKFVGESHDWQAAPAFDLRKFVRTGTNTIAVIVHNRAGQGGLNNGVAVEIREKPLPAGWKRSVFNGLAQIIVQAGSEAGEIKLTARADGLAPATLTLTAQPATPKPRVP
jgi:beta-galactosidase